MEIISHRGNLYGPEPTIENTVKALQVALHKGFSIEFDLWYHEGEYWLGHDKPQKKILPWKIHEWVEEYPKAMLYCHCKDIVTLQRFVYVHYKHLKNQCIPFFHDIDECILLANGNLQVHPKYVNNAYIFPEQSIAVLPQLKDFEYYDKETMKKFMGICTDHPIALMESLNEK